MSTIIDGTAGMTAPVGAVYNGLATLISQASTSGTSIDFTGIPLWVKRVTVLFNDVSTSGTAHWIVQLGSGTVTTSGYLSASSQINNAGYGATSSTSGFIIYIGSASYRCSGTMTFANTTGNTWAASHALGESTLPASICGGGTIALSGTLDRVRITTVGGTNTFDAGTINVMYE